MKILAVLIMLMGIGSSAQARTFSLESCPLAEPPVVVDGMTATEEQMASSGAEVRAFVAAMQDALACLEAGEKALGKEITDEQHTMISTQYNTGVDQLNSVAEEFNVQVRSYKNR